MLFVQILLAAVVSITMASASTNSVSTAIAGIATHDIMMLDYEDPTRQTTLVKFRNVPITYDIMDIKHVDYAGKFWTFSNGETWMTLNGKRLFLTATPEGFYDARPENLEDWPIMEPEELHEALKEYPSFAELDAKWQAVANRLFAPEKLLKERDYRTCRNKLCRTSADCWPGSHSDGNCLRCEGVGCNWQDRTGN